MPWCEPCGRYLTPNSVDVDGSCPSCGNDVDPAPAADRADPIDQRVPWHFWVVIALAGCYLLWRVVQGVALLF